LNFTVVIHDIDGAWLYNGTLYFFIQTYPKGRLANARECIVYAIPDHVFVLAKFRVALNRDNLTPPKALWSGNLG